MSQAECPKCGQPREVEAVECPWCGVIYDRYRGGPPPPPLPTEDAPAEPAAAAPAAPAAETPTAALPEVYGGPLPADGLYQPQPAAAAPSAAPAGAGDHHPVERFETPLTRNLVLSLIVAGMVCIFAQSFWNQQMMNGSSSAEAARDRFLTLAGFEAPRGLDDGATLTLAGRQLAWLAHADAPADEPSLIAGVFRPGRLAGNMDRVALLDGLEDLFDRAELPHLEIASREFELDGRRARSRTYAFGSEEAPIRAFALALETPEGDRTLVFLFGPTGEVYEEMRRVLR